MKIAVPTAQNKLCLHFGHCEVFTFFEIEDGEIKNTEAHTPPPHAPGIIPPWVAKNGATLVIAGGMGQRAINLFNEQGVQVIVGAQPDEPKAVVEAYLAENLELGTNTCSH